MAVDFHTTRVGNVVKTLQDTVMVTSAYDSPQQWPDAVLFKYATIASIKAEKSLKKMTDNAQLDVLGKIEVIDSCLEKTDFFTLLIRFTLTAIFVLQMDTSDTNDDDKLSTSAQSFHFTQPNIQQQRIKMNTEIKRESSRFVF